MQNKLWTRNHTISSAAAFKSDQLGDLTRPYQSARGKVIREVNILRQDQKRDFLKNKQMDESWTETF